ncbi:MAG: BlaI/MecI/CopY family transcriptional regulator [Polyangiaceae bacterium]
MPEGPRPLTRREREIMDVLHRLGRATAQEILDGLAAPPSYSAVRALLRLLEERGHVKHSVDGARYVYAPVVAPSRARKSALAHLVETFFGGSAVEAAATLIESSKAKLTDDELARLERVIRARRAPTPRAPGRPRQTQGRGR